MELSPEGWIRSLYGLGVPTGTSQGTSLPNVGQFVPLLVPDRSPWVNAIDRRRVLGDGPVGDRDAIHVNASVLTDGSSQEIPFDELERRQGGESGLPDGAVYVMRTGPLSIRQDIYLDEQSNELLRASITSRISTEFSIRGLPSDDPRGSVSGLEGTLSSTIERIF